HASCIIGGRPAYTLRHNKQQADRFYKVVKTGKKYPLSDRNAVFNIAKRGLGYISKLGVSVKMPRTHIF
ncbi:MAG TPA: hypothetical protein VE594_02815, partial [Nitrososphaeraceae archaeon]|nr:hypothetical protein [Nitrososphaeraceae archaeon]